MKKIYILLSFCLIQFIAQAQTIPAYVPTNGLVGWWPFNGNANDESGNGNNGTVNGATLTADRNGNVGKAYSFDGVDDLIDVGNPVTLGNNPNSYTMAGWAYYYDFVGGYVFMTKRQDDWGSDWGTPITLQNKIIFFADDQGYASATPAESDTLSTNQWYHFVFVKSINSYTIYMNGIEVSTITDNHVMNGSNNNLIIGAQLAWQDFMKGKLDDIAIWNRALTQQEITAFYQAQVCSLSISSQPTNQSSTTGSNASFNVGVTTDCNPTSYQWQTNTGFGWQTLQHAGQYTGVNTSTLYVSNVNLANTNQLFRCLIQSGNITDTTQTATLSVVNTGNTTLSAVTHAIPYQAVVRDGAGNPLINHPLTVRCTLHDNTASGTSIYQETHTINTNNFGLFTLHIGTGVASIGNIDSIHWALYKKYLQVEFDTTAQGTSYIDLGTQQLMAVPYALYAETAGNALNAPKGDAGVNGSNGTNGVDGSNGQNGNNGVNGADGVSVTSANITNDSLYLSLSNSQTLNAGKLNGGLPNGTNVGDVLTWDGSNWNSTASNSNLPIVATSPASDITTNSATSGGTITSDGGYSIIAKGVCWGTNINPTVSGSHSNEGIGGYSFASNLNNLNPTTNYYYRSYATNSMGTGYGITYVLNTLTPLLPSILTEVINNYGPNSINSGITIINNGNVPIIDAGICWSTTSNPTINSSSYSSLGSLQTGTHNIHINGLAPNTNYYLRSYATNSTGTSYGNELTFITLNPLSIGMSYQGGIVAHILQLGEPGYDTNESHGLIAAPSDLNSLRWSNNNGITGATGTAVGSGSNNTDLISSYLLLTGGSAAKVCSDLILNGYEDWFLPSKDELNKLWINKVLIGGFTNDSYWSSSEYDYYDAWKQQFNTGVQDYPLKTNYFKVRAVRSF